MSNDDRQFRSHQRDANGVPIDAEAYLLDEEGGKTGVDTGGVEIQVPWMRRSRLRRVMAYHLNGSANKFSVIIRSRPKAEATLRDVIFQASFVSTLDGVDQDVDLPFEIKSDPHDEIRGDIFDMAYLEIVPDKNVDNEFEWRVIGTGMI